MPHHHKPDLFTCEPFRQLAAFQDGEGIAKAAIVTLAAAATYIFPTVHLQENAVMAFTLVGIDTATGIIAAFIEKKPRSSTAFGRVLAKAFAYLSVCAVAAIAEKTIFKNAGLSLSMGVLWLIIATEGISVLENVERIGGGRFAFLRKLLGKVIEKDRDPEKPD